MSLISETKEVVNDQLEPWEPVDPDPVVPRNGSVWNMEGTEIIDSFTFTSYDVMEYNSIFFFNENVLVATCPGNCIFKLLP